MNVTAIRQTVTVTRARPLMLRQSPDADSPAVRQVYGLSEILCVPLLCEQCGWETPLHAALLTEQWHTAARIAMIPTHGGLSAASLIALARGAGTVYS